MRSRLHLSVAAFVFILLSSCQDDCERMASNPKYMYQLDNSKVPALFPYKDFEKLKFLKNGSDTVEFTGGERGVSVYHMMGNRSSDCPRMIQVERLNHLFTHPVEGNILIDYYYDEDDYSYDYFSNTEMKYDIDFKSIRFMSNTSPANIVSYSNSSVVYAAGKPYKNVQQFRSNNYSFTETVYFVAGLGIIKAVTSKGTYERIE